MQFRKLSPTTALILLAFLFARQSPANQTLECLEFSWTDTGSELRIEDPSLGNETCDIYISTDLSSWELFDSITVANGAATVSLPFSQSQSSQPVFIRVVREDSTSAVLELPRTPYAYANITLPNHLNTPIERAADNTPNNNPITDEGATLGRVLFYDTQLSRNNTISCASCHVQEAGFSDPRNLSIGFEGGLTGRNSMGLSNAKFYEREHFFWDERAETLEEQTLMPIQDGVEMGMDLETLVQRLQELPYYDDLFESAFGTSEVSSQRISFALSQFVRSILSYQSKYDEGVPLNFTNFTQLEREGLNLFNGRRAACSACHSGPNFVGTRIDNNGLEFPYLDLGVGGVTGRPQDEGKFKMSSLRNIEVTGPYMHDGRFETLEEVIDHYSNGIVPNPNLGNQLGNANNRRPINFTDREKEALVAFLKTLTDQSVLTDPKFSDPFVR